MRTAALRQCGPVACMLALLAGAAIYGNTEILLTRCSKFKLWAPVKVEGSGFRSNNGFF